MPNFSPKYLFFLFASLLLVTLTIILQLDSQFNEEDFNFQVGEISQPEQSQLRDLNTQLAIKKSKPLQQKSDQLLIRDHSSTTLTAPRSGMGGLLVLSNTLNQSPLNDDRGDSGGQHWPMILPLMDDSFTEYPISSHFGYRLDPIHHLPSMHQGVDFLAPIGTPVVATADGVIVKAGHTDGYGLMLEIQHANGFKSKYAHTSLIQVKLGDQVKQGQLIAYVGNSGRSTGAHLHYEVLISNKQIDPIRLLK